MNRLAFLVLTAALTLLAGGAVRADDKIPEYTPDEVAAQVTKNKGAVVFVHLYASWCPPCAREFPELSRIAERYKNQPFKMLVLSTDANLADLRQFLGQMKPTGYEAARLKPGDMSAFERLGMKVGKFIPYTAIFSPAGTVLDQGSGARDFQRHCHLIDEAFMTERPAPGETAPSPPPLRPMPTAKAPEPAAASKATAADKSSGGSSWVWWVLGLGVMGTVGVVGFKALRRT